MGERIGEFEIGIPGVERKREEGALDTLSVPSSTLVICAVHQRMRSRRGLPGWSRTSAKRFLQAASYADIASSAVFLAAAH